MKKIITLIVLVILFIPFFVYAEEKNDNYVLYLTQEFLDYSDKYDSTVEHSLEQKLDYYKKSHLSVRDYLIYKIIFINQKYKKATDFKDNTKFKVSDLDEYYYLGNNEKIKVLDNYKNVEVKIIDSNNTSSSSIIKLTSMDEFLDSDIYCYYLFRELIKDSSSQLEFVKTLKTEEYGYIKNKENGKKLLELNLDNGVLVFNTPKDVEISDNISFLQLDKLSKNIDIDYLSIIFSDKDNNKKDTSINRFNQDLIFVGICAFLSILVISLFIKNKEK